MRRRGDLFVVVGLGEKRLMGDDAFSVVDSLDNFSRQTADGPLVINNQFAILQDELNALTEAVRVERVGSVSDAVWIEDHEICMQSSLEQTAIFEAENLCGKRRRDPDRLFKCQDASFDGVSMNLAGKGAVKPWVHRTVLGQRDSSVT